MRRLGLALLAVVAVSACFATTAAARRAPTQPEQLAIRAALVAYVEQAGGPPASSVVRRIFVSTLDGRYALAKLRIAGEPVLSTAILERRSGVWRVASFGLAGFAFRGVPQGVLNDLLGAQICHC